MSATWRITVESWISPEANWYAQRVFWVEADSLPAACRAVAELPAEVYLDEDNMSTGHHGTATQVRRGDDILRRSRQRRRLRDEGKIV